MRITVYGRGNIGGGLGDLWERAGHQVTRLGRDAGYEPVFAGPLQNAPAQEAAAGLYVAIARSGLGPFFYRMAPPGQL